MILLLISLIIGIVIHELGHLLIAKKLKAGVDIFSIGFGRPLYRKEYKGTIYQIAPILCGGFCQLKDELKITQEADSFTNLSYRKKFFITVAGCVVNLVIGIISFFVGYTLVNYNLMYFGSLNVILGLTNLIPLPPLDGSYIFLVLLEKWIGKEKCYKIMRFLCKWGFRIIMTLNILFIPYLIINWKKLL